MGLRRALRSLLASPRPSRTDAPAKARTPCLDVRPPGMLAAGIVDGAWILDPDTAIAHAAALPAGIAVLAATDDEATRLADALRAAGREDARAAVGGIAALAAAGVAIHEPAWKSPLPTGHAVYVGPLLGWVQDVRWAETEFRFDVIVLRDGRLERLVDLPEEDLRSRGPRGAAGLGEVV